MQICRFVLLAMTLAAPAVGQPPPAAPQPTPRQGSDAAAPLPSVTLPPELDRVLRDYEGAWRARDAKALSELFAEDGFVLANGRPPVRGRAAIRAGYEGAGGPLVLRAYAFATAGDVGYILGGYSGSPRSSSWAKAGSSGGTRARASATASAGKAGRWLGMDESSVGVHGGLVVPA